MFFLPFIGSSICDSLVIYLYSTLSRVDKQNINNESFLAIGDKLTKILFDLALFRLILVCGPLTYHTVTGRKLIWPAAYYALYIFSGMIVLAHMLLITLYYPDNSPPTTSFTDMIRNDEGVGMSISDRRLLILSYSHRVWAMLTFSLWSIALHVVIVWHVRSTGPETVVMDEGIRDARKMKRMMAYASINKLKSMGGGNLHLQKEKLDNGHFSNGNSEDETPQNDGINDNTKSHYTDFQEESSLLLHNGDVESTNVLENSQIYRNTSDAQQNQVLKSKNSFDVDDFFSDIQARMKNARLQWSEKLNELQMQMLQDNSGNVLSSTNNFFLSIQLSPFRVLLQLFAYEEVLANGRLDACFELDDGEGLTFYVPQLLSFLLHGAYLNTPDLEIWILKKCKENVHFAHRCFWFLRAWCLGHGSHQNPVKSGSEQSFIDMSNESLLPQRPKRLYGSETNLYKYPSTFSSSSTYFNQYDAENDEYEFSRNRGQSFPHEDSSAQGSKAARGGSKYPIEEHRLIEALLFRVIDCGEVSATILQFGRANETLDDESNIHKSELCTSEELSVESPVGTFLASATEKGFIPVDPSNGFPSVRHLDSYTSKRKYGFMPLHGETSLHESDNGYHFLSTPRFLDALTTIADDLMLVQREKRTKELRKRLKTLEVELLPSNVVYLPINNVHHRVWRIVAEESIAISTNERVPCIVCLEVVDYNASAISTVEDDTSNKIDSGWRSQKRKESDILKDWYRIDRNPNRHNSLLNKVTQYTHKSLKIWRDDSDLNTSMRSNLLKKDDISQSFDIESHNDFSCEMLDKREKSPVKSSKKPDLLPPLPPLSKAISQQLAPVGRAINLSYGSGSENSPKSSRGSSPTVNIGQWSSPTFEQSRVKDVYNKNAALQFQPIATDLTSLQTDSALRRKKDEIAFVSTVDGNSLLTSSNSLISNFDEEAVLNKDIPGINKSVFSSVASDRICDARDKSSRKNQLRPPPVVFKEDWSDKESRFRSRSAYGNNPGWRLLPVLLKSNDDLRQEQLASQLIQRMSVILAKGKVPVWLCPYEIIALNDRGGLIEAIPDTISLDSLKRNYPNFTSLYDFFTDFFGSPGSEAHDGARANFVESMAAYSMVCFIMQIKDRHNGNILLDRKGHIIHIDFGFFFLSSPGKNSGFESAPFKLTSDFVALMEGPFSRTFARFRDLCYRTFLELRKHCYEITILVEMLMEGNEDLACFRHRPKDAVRELRERFRLDLSDRACLEYVNSLIDESLENWRTTWYDRYQRYCVGVL